MKAKRRRNNGSVLLLTIFVIALLSALVIGMLQMNTEEIPVIMLTAKRTIGNIEDAYEAKADSYITKPFDPAVLAQVIRNKLRECLSNRRKYWKEEDQEKPDSPQKRNPANLVG